MLESSVVNKTSPSLIISVDGNSVSSYHVVGFGKTLVENQGEAMVKAGLLSLMATYYFLDLEYPSGYAVMLKFIQHCIIGQKVKDLPKTIRTLCSKATIFA